MTPCILQNRQYITFPLQTLNYSFPNLLYMDNSASSDMGGAGAAASSAGNARWNPTKEQIGILEGMYKQGVRTPTAEQIQQITARLRAYGHIEGKNVFYWFQNHKARQRQRERQESLAFLNRCFHRPLGPPPPPPPLHHFSPCPSVVCRPYYVPQSDQFGVYPAAASQIMVPCGFKRRHRSDLMEERRENKNLREHRDEGGIYNMVDQKTTLELFPLLPMNNPKHEEEESIVSVEHKPSHQRSTTSDLIEEHKHQPFFDFFTNKTTYHEY